ncbi:CHAT domain-containing protein [Spirosoma harenae]
MFLPLSTYAQIDPSLLAAIRQNNPQTVIAVLRAGVNPNATDSLGATPLMWACYQADTAVVQTLIKAGAKPECQGVIRTNSSTYYGNLTGLAAGLNKISLLRYLLETLQLPVNEPEYNPETKQNDGWTPVEWAAANGHLAVLTYLAEKGGNLTIANGNPMVLAINNNRTEIVAMLISRGLMLEKMHSNYNNVVVNYFKQLIPIAKIFEKKGQYHPASLAFEQIRIIYGEPVDKQDTTYATLLINLAGVYQLMGQYEKALPLYEETKGIYQQVLGKLHPDYATSLNNLASLYQQMGQYEKARPLYEEARGIYQQVLGTLHPNYATSLINLAGLYESMGQYEKALPLYEEAKGIYQQVLGKLHPNYATSLNNLAYLYKLMGQYKKALLLFEEAREIRQQVLGKMHPNYAASINNLAYLYQQMGQYEKARPLYEEAREIYQQVLGTLHPEYATSLTNLAYLYQLMGQYEKALPIILQVCQQYRSQLLNQIGMLNESAIGEFQYEFDRSDFVYSFTYKVKGQALAGQHYTDALLRKGVGLLATQQLNGLLSQARDTIVQRLASQLHNTRQRINQQLNRRLTDQRSVDSLQRSATALEQQLVLRLPEYRQAFEGLRVEWPQVQKALKSDEAAIEFVQFDYYNRRLRTVDGKKVWQPGWTDSTFYAAVVLRPGWSTPRFVVLAEGRALDKWIALKPGEDRRAGYIDRLYTAPDRGGVVSAGNGKPQPSLYALIWKPLDSLLTGAKRVYYSPAGMLHRLNLAALPITSAQRVGEKYQLTLLSSTRQLALSNSYQYGNKRALLLGGITYERDTTAYRKANARFRLAQSRDDEVATRASETRGAAWNELKNTAPEVQAVRALLASNGYQPDTLTGLRASEEAFYAITQQPEGSPRILHLATHGFFYEAPKSTTAIQKTDGGSDTFAQSKEALIRSGLALAGANAFWRDGQITPNTEDGILTANDVSLLRLNQTELVVLSACETGLGDLKGSEGVYGLQRAFKMAGVQNILMSLWQVPDKPTRLLIQSFYREYVKPGQTVRSAFDEAVRQLREQYEEPYFWAGFVLVQ